MANISVGVFIPHNAQFLDVATVDVLSSLSREYLGATPGIPQEDISTLPHLNFHYITSSENPNYEVNVTAGGTLKATRMYTDEEVAPGELDIVVVPGPDPTAEFDEGGLEWLKAHVDTGKVDLLSVCTGALVCAAAGVFDGKHASGPKNLQGVLKEKYPDVKWDGGIYRWLQDGNIWSSGGVTNGNDLMAAYARASTKYWPSRELVEIGLSLVDVGDRDQLYKPE